MILIADKFLRNLITRQRLNRQTVLRISPPVSSFPLSKIYSNILNSTSERKNHIRRVFGQIDLTVRKEVFKNFDKITGSGNLRMAGHLTDIIVHVHPTALTFDNMYLNSTDD